MENEKATAVTHNHVTAEPSGNLNPGRPGARRLLTLSLLAVLGVALLVLARIGGSGPVAAFATLETATPPTSTPPVTSTPPTATATSTTVPVPVTSPVLNFSNSVCVASSATVTFSWQPGSGAISQYLDLSLSDNNFVDGTYVTTGELIPSTNSVTWNGIRPGLAHFWRVTAFTASGWVSSSFATFSPCGPAVLLPSPFGCTGAGRATVTFRWSPTSPPGFLQYVDITLFDNGFAPGTFLGGGPFSPAAGVVVWPGILTNTVHFWRVNTLTASGWVPSTTGVMVAQC